MTDEPAVPPANKPPMKPTPEQLTGAPYHFFLFSDVDGTAPTTMSGSDLKMLMQSAHAAIMRAGSGWCYFLINGVRCTLSQPMQVYKVRLPDGTYVEMGGQEDPAFNEDGRFSTLRDIRPIAD